MSPEVATGDDNNDNDPGNGGGNGNNAGDSTDASGGSSSQPGNNSGGAGGSTSHTLQLTDNTTESSRTQLPRERIWSRDHPFDLIIGDPDVGVRTRSATTNECLFSGFLSQLEPKKIDEALADPDWVLAMQEELNQFERQEVWALVPEPKGKSIIGTRWVFRNKLDGDGIVVRNKARLVAKGYSQEE